MGRLQILDCRFWILDYKAIGISSRGYYEEQFSNF